MDLGLAGMKALVTGGTKGIGRAVAEHFAAEGCDVAICARNAEEVAQTVAALSQRGVKATGRAVDVADGPALTRWVDDVGAEATSRADDTLAARATRSNAASRDTGSDPWQALAQIGAQFVAALAAANDPNAIAHPWIERDPVTGAQSLKMPLPAPETARQLANALSALADGLRSRMV